MLGGICLLAGRLVAGREEPLLWLPLGLGTIVALGGLAGLSDPTGELLVPACLAAAIAGAWLLLGDLRAQRRGADAPSDAGRGSPGDQAGLASDETRGGARRSGEARWAIGAAALAFLVFGAPVLASGEATFAGYIKLDDTATWLALSDHLAGGADPVSALPPSTYEATLSINLGNGYPLGAFVPLALGDLLTGQDAAWLFAPALSLCAAALALALFALGRELVASPGLRAVAAVVASCSALLVAYALWGAIKEVMAAALIATVYAAAASGGRRAPALTALMALALALSLSPAGALWAGGALALVLARAWRSGVRPSRGVLVGLIVAALAVGIGIVLAGFLSPFRRSFSDDSDLGNLGSPLDPLHLAGIWPAGDFRFPAELPGLSYALIALAAGLLALALVLGWRRRALGPLAYACGTAAAVVAICVVGSPWVDAKAMAIAAPVVLFGAALAGAALVERGGALAGLGVVALVALAIGAGWSDVLAYRDASLAPADQLAELELVGGMIEDEGPTLLTEYEPYGARHFLREGATEGASDLRRRDVPLRGGRSLGKGEFADLDELGLAPLVLNRSLVLRRSPVTSRPPAPYELVWSGEFYELWQRPAGAGAGKGSPRLHVGLGSERSPVGEPRCEQLITLFKRRGQFGGVLAAASRLPVISPRIAPPDYPAAWLRPDEPQRPQPRVPGVMRLDVTVDRADSYAVWLRGSVHSLAEARIDGREVGSARGALNNSEGWISLGEAELDRGVHELELEISGADLHPGSGAYPEPIGPLALAPTDSRPRLSAFELTPGTVLRSCLRNDPRAPALRRDLDWIELLRD